MDRSLSAPRARLGALLLIVALASAACASGAAAPSAARPAADQAAGGNGNGQSGGNGPDSDNGNGTNGGNPGNGNGNSGRPADPAVVLPDGTKIVYTGTLSVQVSDVPAAVTAGRAAVAAVGGYLSGSRQSLDGDQAVASITYRIPADRWEDALVALRALGTVVGEETDAEEVTGQLVDLNARIRNMRLSEAAIQRLTERATTIDDLLAVEQQLSALRGQIEQLDAQRAALEDRSALGTLTVTYGEAVVAIVKAAEGWNAGKDLDAASATLLGFLQQLTSAGIWFGLVWLPILLVLSLLLLIGRFVLRRTGLLGRLQEEISPPVIQPPAAPG